MNAPSVITDRRGIQWVRVDSACYLREGLRYGPAYEWQNHGTVVQSVFVDAGGLNIRDVCATNSGGGLEAMWAPVEVVEAAIAAYREKWGES